MNWVTKLEYSMNTLIHWRNVNLIIECTNKNKDEIKSNINLSIRSGKEAINRKQNRILPTDEEVLESPSVRQRTTAKKTIGKADVSVVIN